MQIQIAIPMNPYNFQWGCLGLPDPQNQAGIWDAFKNNAPTMKRIIKMYVAMIFGLVDPRGLEPLTFPIRQLTDSTNGQVYKRLVGDRGLEPLTFPTSRGRSTN